MYGVRNCASGFRKLIPEGRKFVLLVRSSKRYDWHSSSALFNHIPLMSFWALFGRIFWVQIGFEYSPKCVMSNK